MGMAVETGKPGKGPKPTINVTPLVDVVLVLLIIFMLIIPNMQDDKPIELVNVMFPDKDGDESKKEEALIVTIDRAETFTIDQQDMSREQALGALREAHARNPKRKVLLRGDAKLPYKAMRTFFKDAQEVGFPAVALAVGAQRKWDGAKEVE